MVQVYRKHIISTAAVVANFSFASENFSILAGEKAIECSRNASSPTAWTLRLFALASSCNYLRGAEATGTATLNTKPPSSWFFHMSRWLPHNNQPRPADTSVTLLTRGLYLPGKAMRGARSALILPIDATLYSQSIRQWTELEKLAQRVSAGVKFLKRIGCDKGFV